MSTQLLFFNPRDFKQDSFLSNILSEVPTSSNTAILECLRQLYRLDQQIIALQSKKETVHDIRSKQTEMKRLKTQEQEKGQQLDEARLTKNQTEDELDRRRQRITEIESTQQETRKPDKVQKNSKELLHLKNLEQNLEFKASHIKNEIETLISQVTSLQDKQPKLANELQSISAINKAKDQEVRAEVREIEAQKLHFQGQLPPRYLSLYQKIGALRGGIAIVQVFRNSCGGCHMIFPPQFIIELTRSEGIEQCPACRRILLPPLQDKKND